MPSHTLHPHPCRSPKTRPSGPVSPTRSICIIKASRCRRSRPSLALWLPRRRAALVPRQALYIRRILLTHGRVLLIERRVGADGTRLDGRTAFVSRHPGYSRTRILRAWRGRNVGLSRLRKRRLRKSSHCKRRYDDDPLHETNPLAVEHWCCVRTQWLCDCS
jgi:hypothetical protein